MIKRNNPDTKGQTLYDSDVRHLESSKSETKVEWWSIGNGEGGRGLMVEHLSV